MTSKTSAAVTALSLTSSVLCFSGALLLFASVGGHGFWSGMAQGAGIAFVLLGAALFGGALAGNRKGRAGWWLPGRNRGEWLPSRDGGAAAGARDE